MYELKWEQVNFSNERMCHSQYDSDSIIKKACLAIGTAILILGGLLIIAWSSIHLYTMYTQNKQIEQALQMAKDQNRQIDLSTSNKFNFVLNVSSNTSLSMAGKSSGVTRVTVYPRNHSKEYVRMPGGITVSPYADITEF